MTAALPDILNPALYTDGIPHDLLRDLRREHPVVWVDEPATDTFDGGRGYWLALRHADVSHVSRHPEDFSSWRGTSFLRDQRPSDVAVLRRMMLNMDPPDHGSLRKIVNKRLHPAGDPSATRRGDRPARPRGGRRGLRVGDRPTSSPTVAAEMPLLVLADVLGVPAEDRKLLYGWTNRLVGLDDPEYGADPEAFLSAFTEMFAYARAATKERRTNPTGDLWSTVVNAEVDGERLSDGDLDRFFQLLVIAGNDTTRNLLANTMLTLSQHPDQFARLRADLSLLPSAIEEVLRFSPSVIQFRRTATRDLEFAGQHISENDRVIINYASANRDETVFTDPDRFDITRDPNPHISFGDGTHFCLGANLARLQVRVLLDRAVHAAAGHRGERCGQPPAVRVHERHQAPTGAVHARGESRAGLGRAKRREIGAGRARCGRAPNQESRRRRRRWRPTARRFSSFTARTSAPRRTSPPTSSPPGRRRGFAARSAALDEAVEDLPTDGVVLVATATYNGTPPDNAVRFAEWITAKDPDLTGVKFGVFGVGNHEWAATFQDFPRLIDDRLAQLGATRLHVRGEGDVADDFDGAVADWDTALWPSLAQALGLDFGTDAGDGKSGLTVEFLPSDRPSPFVASLDARPMRVHAVRDLTQHNGAVEVRPVRHIELELPKDVSLRGRRPPRRRPAQQRDAGGPGDRPVRPRPRRVDPARRRRRRRVDLPADRRARHRRAPAQRLRRTTGCGGPSRHRTPARVHRIPLEPGRTGTTAGPRHLPRGDPAASPFGAGPARAAPDLPPAVRVVPRPAQPARAAVLLDLLVVAGSARRVLDHRRRPRRRGTLRHRHLPRHLLELPLRADTDRVVHAFVRDTSSSFRLPSDPSTPVLMIGSGTGMAPFRGFLQERMALKQTGARLGPALLVFGCRHPQLDQLYGDELAQLADAADVQLACAYSRVAGLPRVYVQDRLRQLGEQVMDLLDDGAVGYVCGATAMADGARTGR